MTDGSKLCAQGAEAPVESTAATAFQLGIEQYPLLPARYIQPRWYPAYTHANHEKRVAEQLGQRSVDHFVPLYETARRWKDRRVRLELPLFPGYVFVRLALRDRLRVLQVPSVVRLVGFDSHQVALSDREIEGSSHRRTYASSHRTTSVSDGGPPSQSQAWPLEGVEGILIRKKNAVRVALSINTIMRSASVEVDIGDVEGI